MKNSTCPICKNTNNRVKIYSPKFNVFECAGCKSNFVTIHPTKEKQKEDYFDSYATDKYIAYYKKFRTGIFKENWKVITSHISRGNGMDFGASFGWFIECAPKSWDVLGI